MKINNKSLKERGISPAQCVDEVSTNHASVSPPLGYSFFLHKKTGNQAIRLQITPV